MDASQNDNFGSPANGSVPISSGTGDIVLVNDTLVGDSKRKRIFLILGVFLILALFVTLIILVVIPSLSLTSSEKYNKYMNYLIYGNESTENLSPEENEDTLYAINKAFYDYESAERLDYIKTLKSLWEDSVKSFGSDLEKDGNVLNISDDIGFLYVYAEAYESNRSSMSEDEVDVEDLEKYYDGVIQSFESSKNNKALYYAAALDTYVDLLLKSDGSDDNETADSVIVNVRKDLNKQLDDTIDGVVERSIVLKTKVAGGQNG